MIREKEDEKYVYFLDYFQGKPVHMKQDKTTGEIFFNADDVCHILGVGSFDEFIGTDEGLDIINDFKKENPNMPVFGENGMFRRG